MGCLEMRAWVLSEMSTERGFTMYCSCVTVCDSGISEFDDKYPLESVAISDGNSEAFLIMDSMRLMIRSILISGVAL